MKRAKLVFSRSHLHAHLGLPDHVTIVGFDHTVDPASLTVLLDSPKFDDIPEDWESPIIALRDLDR